MKKNTMMRVASVLLIAVLLSTCAISGTFAKYVTKSSATEVARVAKWGVDFVITTDMFKTTYQYDAPPHGDFTGKLSVESDNGNKVVAPGTSGTGYSLSTIGTPEVSYVVTFGLDIAASQTVYLDIGGDVYRPVSYTLTLGASSYTSNDLAKIASNILTYKYMYDVDSGHYYTTADNGTTWTDAGTVAPKMVLSWSWAFSTSPENDIKDTALGDIAAGVTPEIAVTGSCTDISLVVTSTATQID